MDNNKSNFSSLFSVFRLMSKSFVIMIIVFFVIFGLCVTGYFLDLFINVKSGNYEHPLFGGYVIVSQSMVPTINVNDAVVVKRENNDKYAVGDVITFKSDENNYEGYPITHRIISKEEFADSESSYTTKGDNNSIADPSRVYTSNIYGKVMFVIPKLGYLKSFLAKPSNFFLCVLIPTLIVFIYDFSRIFSAMNKREYN